MTDPRRYPSAVPAPHRFDVRVYWEDTDAAGIVYYANYLKFMERARSELVRQLGIDQAELLRRDGLVFPVQRCDISYLRPARLEDEIVVETAVLQVGGASIALAQDIYRDVEQLTRARVRLACIDGDGRPQRLPPHVKSAMAGIVGTGEGSA